MDIKILRGIFTILVAFCFFCFFCFLPFYRYSRHVDIVDVVCIFLVIFTILIFRFYFRFVQYRRRHIFPLHFHIPVWQPLNLWINKCKMNEIAGKMKNLKFDAVNSTCSALVIENKEMLSVYLFCYFIVGEWNICVQFSQRAQREMRLDAIVHLRRIDIDNAPNTFGVIFFPSFNCGHKFKWYLFAFFSLSLLFVYCVYETFHLLCARAVCAPILRSIIYITSLY